MSYLIAKKFDVSGCVALDVTNRKNLPSFIGGLNLAYLSKRIQFVVLGNPKVYGEYKPYNFVDTERQFLDEVHLLSKTPANIPQDISY
jgi:hypothetical protein